MFYTILTKKCVVNTFIIVKILPFKNIKYIKINNSAATYRICFKINDHYTLKKGYIVHNLKIYYMHHFKNYLGIRIY